MGELSGQLSESRTAVRDVMRNVGLRRINAAFAGSIIGDWAYAVAVSVYAYREGGATAVGVFGVARYVSMAVVGPFASTLADRHDRKAVMVTADLVRVVLVGVAAALVAIDAPSLGVYALAVVAGVCGTAFRPAQSAMLPQLATHPGELTAANAVSSTVESVGFFIGPAIAAGLLAATDVATVFAFDAATFLWSAVLVGRVPVPGVAPDELVADDDEGAGGEATGSRLAEVGAGFREIGANRDLLVLVALYCGQTLIAGASLVFSVAIALDLLDLGESGVGLLNATVGIGGILGGFGALLLAQRGRLAVDFGIGVLLWAVPLLLIAAVPDLAAALVAMAVIGFGNSLVDINAYTILQRLARDEVMGRVFGALESLIIAGMAIGSLAMPLLVNTVGLRTGLVVLGAAVGTLTIAALPRLRRIDTIALAPDGLDLLRAVSIFAPLPERTVERLARTSELVTVAAGEAVFRQGDHGDRFYVVEDGEARISVDGAEVGTATAGGWFGEIALLRDVPRTASVTALTELRLRAVERRHFLTAVTGHAETWVRADRGVERTLLSNVFDLRDPAPPVAPSPAASPSAEATLP
jgi:MFS family permease